MMQTGYITVADGFIYASTHTPADAASAPGLLIIPPMTEERKCAYRLLYELAEQCCTDLGMTVMRFDPRGTGESSGDHRDASLTSWTEDCNIAIDTLRNTCKGPIFVLGARFGANVALKARTALAMDGLVLLEPLMSGDAVLRDMVRRKQIKEMMGGGKATSDDAGLEAAWVAGEAVDVDGFEIGSTLYSELKPLDLLEDLASLPNTMPTLLCHVGGAKTFTGKWATAQERLTPPSQAICVRQKPFWGQLDYQESVELKDTVVEFLKTTIG